MNLLFKFLVVSATLLSSMTCLSQEFRVQELKIEGFSRTKDYVIERELEFKAGDLVDAEKIEVGMRRLKNTNIFYDLAHTIEGDGEQRVVIVRGKDRWTTIPVAKVSSGGGANQLILGLYDPNVLGHQFELGGQYERLGETNSGVFWYRNNWLSGKRIFLDFQVWNINRLRTKYELDRQEAVEKKGYLHSRKKYYLGLTKEINRQVSVGIFVDRHQDEFSERYVSEEIKVLNKNHPEPPSIDTLFVGLSLTLGLVQFQDHLVDGESLKIVYRQGQVDDQEIDNFSSTDIEAKFYRTLKWSSTIAFRLLYGSTDTDAIQYFNYLGGLDRIRGFKDNRFAGKHFWLANSEYRLPVYNSAKTVVQATTFYDVASIKEDDQDLGSAHAASVGVGIRLIFPQIYRFVARLDYAKTLLRKDEAPISFGVQQFF